MRRFAFSLVFFTAFSFAGSILASPQVRSAASREPILARGQERAADAEDIDAKLRQAAGQHAIIAIYLEEGKHDAVSGEFQKILDLGFSGEYEKLVTQAAWQTVEKLREARRFSLAHEIVNKTLNATAEVENRFSLLMLRGKIFQDQKLYGQAIEAVREAQSLKPE